MEMFEDIRYAIKAIDCVLSGYDGLVHKVNGEWEKIEGDDLYEDPYYVCAQFINGRHIPLPLITGNTDDEPGPLQVFVLGWISRHCEWRGVLRGYYHALADCAWYEMEMYSDPQLAAALELA
jgi:hypothetical protein